MLLGALGQKANVRTKIPTVCALRKKYGDANNSDNKSAKDTAIGIDQKRTIVLFCHVSKVWCSITKTKNRAIISKRINKCHDHVIFSEGNTLSRTVLATVPVLN